MSVRLDREVIEAAKRQISQGVRDWVHESDLNRCGTGSDTCGSWPVVDEIMAHIEPRMEAAIRAVDEVIELSQHPASDREHFYRVCWRWKRKHDQAMYSSPMVKRQVIAQRQREGKLELGAVEAWVERALLGTWERVS